MGGTGRQKASTSSSRVAVFALALALAMVGLAPAFSEPPRRGPRCAKPNHRGGDWPFLNHDLRNTRNQHRESVIGVQQAASLVPVWTFSVDAAGAEGGLQSTPIVANGCVYIAAGAEEIVATEIVEPEPIEWEGGVVFALNADTGELVWKTPVNGFVLGLAAANGLIYAFPSESPESAAPSGVPEPAGGHAVALNAFTGTMVWSSERLDSDEKRHGTVINASPVVFTVGGRSLLFAPISIGYFDGARIPLYFLDAMTGAVVKRFFALDDEEYQAGFGGAGIWTTAAFDAATNRLYAGTADSEGHRKQHPHNNAILKIDADPAHESIVDAYTGTSEHYDLDRTVPGWQNNPVCETPLAELLTVDPSQSLACLENDLDFGSSPNLYVDGNGRTLVAALQKSGVLHVVDTSTMDAVWTKVLSVPHAISNAATGAIDGESLYVRVFPDIVFSFDRTSGDLEWSSSTGVSPSGYQPLTLANGVLYTITDAGGLVALDAASGRMLLHRAIFKDAGLQSCYGWGAGVAVARNTIYAPCDADQGLFLPGGPGTLVAYRPGP